MKPDNKNFFLAIVLSMLIIAVWQYFYVIPNTPAPQATQQQTQGGEAAPGVVPGAIPTARQNLEEALASSPRVPIAGSDTVGGSINLKGAQIDDLRFLKYHETVKREKEITFLFPSGAKGALFAEFGWFAAQGVKEKLPTPDTVWTAPAGAKLEPGKPVTAAWDNGEGLLFKRSFALDDKYMFTVKDEVVNNRQTPAALYSYGRIQRQGTPATEGIWVLFEGPHGVLDGDERQFGYSDLVEPREPITFNSTGGWLGFTDKYWAIAAIPGQQEAIKADFISGKDAAGQEFYQTQFQSRGAVTIAPGATGGVENKLFAGSKKVEIIDGYRDQYGIANFDLMIDWGWFWYFTKPLYYLLAWLYNLVGDFGVAFLIVTVLVKLFFFPLQNKAYESMSKMKKLQPEMEKLKELHKDDKMKMQQELMGLYKKEKVSPLAGCLPIVIQIPVFFALYKVIYTTIDLRHAPFLGIVQDLSAMDPTNLFNLFGLLPFTPPAFLALGIWPILMGITMWLQMRLNPTPADPIQASMFNWMPLIFTFMLASFPVGLVIYWTWNNFLSILQQSYIMKRNGVEVNFFGNIKESLPFLFKKKSASETKP